MLMILVLLGCEEWIAIGGLLGGSGVCELPLGLIPDRPDLTIVSGTDSRLTETQRTRVAVLWQFITLAQTSSL